MSSPPRWATLLVEDNEAKYATDALKLSPEEHPAPTAHGEQFINAGDQDAFAALMKRHGPYILSVCKHVTSHVQDAEDVFQACFLELVKKASSIRRSHSVAGWLHTVAVRLSHKARTRRALRERREAMTTAVEPTAAPEDLSWRDACRVLQEELAQLPEELRLPIILCLFEGLTQEEAGQVLDVNPRTVKDRLRRGRELLRDRRVRRGVTLAILGTLLTATNLQAALPAALTQTTMCGATAVATHAPLAGVVSPAVLGLTASSFSSIAWIAAAASILLAAALTAIGGVIAWDQWTASAPPPAQEVAKIAAIAPSPPRKIEPPPSVRTVRVPPQQTI